MVTENETGFVAFLGQKVRRLRKEQHLTQLDLAQQVGITNGQISTIERGVSSPSIATLHRISAVLGVPMAEFFEDDPSRQVEIVRAGAGRVIEGTDQAVRVEVLAQKGRSGGFNCLSIEVDEGEIRISPKPNTADEYFLYVLKGKCNLRLDSTSYSLESSDSIYINARKEQWIRNVGTGKFQALLVSQAALIGSEIQTLLASAGA